MKTRKHSTWAFCLIVCVAFTTGLHAQTTWDGNGDANNSGNWATGNNWSTDLVPDTVAVQLNDVTTGTRTVTYDSANPAITGLSLSQSTAGAVNALVVDGQTLTVNASSISATQTAGTLSISVVSGGTMLMDTGDRIDKTFSNSGTLILGSVGSDSGTFRVADGGIDFTHSGTASFYNDSFFGRIGGSSEPVDVNNSGTLNLAGGTGTGVGIGVKGSLLQNAGPFTLDNLSGGTVNVSRAPNESTGTGLVTLGDLGASSRRAASVKATNAGTFNVAENSVFLVRQLRASTDTAKAEFDNQSNLNIGNAASTTAAGGLEFRTVNFGSGSNANLAHVLDNSGTINLYGASIIKTADNSGSFDAGVLQVNNAVGGVLNLYDTSTIGRTGRKM